MRIFILEDSDSVARGMARLLRLCGHEVNTAATLQAALEQVKKQEFGAVVADMGLSDGHTGISLLVWLEKNRPQVRRVLISGSRYPEQIQEEERSWHIFLRKPFVLENLLDALLLSKKTEEP